MARTHGAVAVTDEKKEAMIAAVSAGLTFEAAAKLAGVSVDWMKHERMNNPAWKERCDKAMEHFKLTHLANIAKHSKNTWTASAWLLERSFPEQYNTRVALDLTSGGKELKEPNWFGKAMDIEDAEEIDDKLLTDGEEEKER